MTTTLTFESARSAAAQAYRMILPEVTLIVAACVLFVLAVVLPRRRLAMMVSLFGVAVAFTQTFWLSKDSAFANISLAQLYYSPFDPTGVAQLIRVFALTGAALLVLIGYHETTRKTVGEYYGCLLVLAAGVSIAGRANDLITVYLALELVSIPTYILLYLPYQTRTGQEASAKYFMLSILSSAILLFGFSYLYGLTGATNLTAISHAIADANMGAGMVSPMAIAAAVCVLAGIGFKVTAFPFHFYAPDVYQAGPTGVVAALATAPKIAGFLAIFRVFGEILAPVANLNEHPFGALHSTVPLMVFLLAAASMTFGNVLALLQDNLRRMLAFSGVAHAGYMLMGLAASGAGTDPASGTIPASGAVVFYLGAYGLMTLGAFAALAAAGTAERPLTTVDDLAGLAKDRPLAAFALAVALLSMIGLPLTAGFSGKLLLFISAWNAPTSTPMGNMFRILLAIAAVNAAVGAVYYLRALGTIYLRTAITPFAGRGCKLALLAALLCAFGTLFLGTYSKPLAEAVRKAVPVKM